MRIVALVGTLVAGVLLVGCESLIQTEIKDRTSVSSPRGEYIADGFHTLAKVTMAHDSTVVRLRTKEMSFDDEASTPVLVVDDLGDFSLAWTNDHELVVHYTPGPTPYLQESTWRDVTIRYIPR